MTNTGRDATESATPVVVPTGSSVVNERYPAEIWDNVSAQPRNSNRINDWRCEINISSVSRTYQGSTPEIGEFMGLRTET